jgi:hypothetical protein
VYFNTLKLARRLSQILARSCPDNIQLLKSINCIHFQILRRIISGNVQSKGTVKAVLFCFRIHNATRLCFAFRFTETKATMR